MGWFGDEEDEGEIVADDDWAETVYGFLFLKGLDDWSKMTRDNS